MPYPEIMIRPMREDLTRLGVEELRTADAVDETIRNSKGTFDGRGELDLRLCGWEGAARCGARAAKRGEAGQDDCFCRCRYRSH